MGLGEFHVAAAVRDIIRAVAEETVNRLRPDTMIGQVYDYNFNDGTMTVLFPGHVAPDELITVNFAPDQVPTSSVIAPWLGNPPDVVRIGGKPGSYFVVNYIKGDPRQMKYEWATVPTSGIVDWGLLDKNNPPLGWIPADGSFVPIDLAPWLFLGVGHAYNNGVDPGDGTFKLPNLVSDAYYVSSITGFDVQADWTLGSQNLEIRGDTASMYILATKANTAITMPADGTGNISNSNIAKLNNADWYPIVNQPPAAGGTGRTASYQFSSTAGMVSLAAMAGTATLAVGDSVTFGGSWKISPPSTSLIPRKLIKT